MLARVGRLLPYNCQIAQTFYWPDALTAAKPPMEMTHYQQACGKWGGLGNIDKVSLCLPCILGDTIITGCNLTSSPGQNS